MADYNIPSVQELDKYAVNRSGQYEKIVQSLYDFQSYPVAGSTQLTFFQTPAGQSSKTFADTNMSLAGQLPSGQSFLAQSLEIHFLPGGTTFALPSNGPQADGPSQFLNDLYNVGKAGWMEFTIGSKVYSREAPLNRMPPTNRIDGFSALSTSLTAGASTQTRDVYAAWSGKPLVFRAPLLLTSTQNFSVTLNFPTAVALGAQDTSARIGIVLQGILYRNSQ